MHAHNPVDWYPWGEEALARAKKENKLIFLSIGYSSCYWCHVMERESFHDEELAAELNKNFICIKVDREERPDVDDVYMTALQLLAQRSGWPMSLFLTPDGEPFVGGTYFPPRARDGATGFDDVLKAVQRAWDSEEDSVRAHGKQVVAAVRDRLRQRPVIFGQLDRSPLDTLGKELADTFDRDHGGFGFSETNPRQPKFSRRVEPVLPAGPRPPRRQGRALPHHVADVAGEDGPRGDPRPRRRRFSSLQHRPLLADPALREDALRPGRAGIRLCASF
jgi:uncharacterized protein YyaL (SSP411 family)